MRSCLSVCLSGWLASYLISVSLDLFAGARFRPLTNLVSL